MESLCNKRRFSSCLYKAYRVGKAVQERPVSRALTLGSVDPAGRMSASSSCMVCSWALIATHTKGSDFLQKAEMSSEPCPTKGSRAGGTCSDHGVSSCPRDANPDFLDPVHVANLFEDEKFSSREARLRACPGFQVNVGHAADDCEESPQD